MSEPHPPTNLPDPIDVLGLPIRPLNTEGLIEVLAQRAKAGLRTSACYANAHTVNLARRNEAFRTTLTNCDLLYADGASVVWASRWSTRPLPERMTSADYFPRFAKRCADNGLSIFLLGGKPDIAAKAAENLIINCPTLKITGTHHGHFKPEESANVVEMINTANPDVLAIGLSSPRQELWLAENAEMLNVPVRWCVGALFDYLAGTERRAPQWLCRLGCEWVFRLLLDPVGKWRRYLVGNPTFVWSTICWGLKKNHKDRQKQ